MSSTRHGRNGSVLFASPAAEPLFGASVADLLGHGLFDRVHVADRPAYLNRRSPMRAPRAGRRVPGAAGPTGRRPQKLRSASSGSRCAAARSTARSAETPPPQDREVVAVMRDVTERKAQEQALEDARSDAEQANTAKGHFLAT